MKETQEEQKSKKSVTYYIEIVLIILILIAIITAGYAFAKYLTSITGGTKADIAKWHFDITNGSKDSTGLIQFAMTRTDTNTAVAKDKLAPGTSGEFRIVINTEGTEVSLAYNIKIKLTECPENLVFFRVADATEKVIEGEKGEDTRDRVSLSKFGGELEIERYLPLEKASRRIYRNYILEVAFRHRNNTRTKRYK